jgi:hypothetical protein
MIDELERICKNETVAQSMYDPQNLPGVTEKKQQITSIRITGVPAEIRTEHLPNMNLERYRHANLLGFFKQRRAELLRLSTATLKSAAKEPNMTN